MQKNRKMFWLVGQIVVLILCVYYLQSIYFTQILPDKMAAATFKETQCKVIEKSWQVEPSWFHSYRGHFTVTYTVDGKAYQAVTSGNGLDQSFAFDLPMVQALLDQFDIGKTSPCWYDPSKPQTVILSFRKTWTSTFFLMIPLIIAIIMIYYLLRSLSAIIQTRKK